MAAAAIELLEPKRWAQVSAAAAADARARFATGDVVQQYERLYEDALASVQ